METNKIYNIDCIEGFKNLEDNSISHILTSPPYNRLRNDKYAEYDDTKEDYFKWLCIIIDECLRVTKGYIFFNIQKNYYNKSDVFKIIGKYANNIQEIIIWEKTNPMPAAGRAISNSYEFILVMSNISLKSNTTYTKNLISTSVNGNMPINHKAVMKQDVANWIIEKFTQEGELILDCFMGLGTSAIACINKKRNFIGFEISEEYCKIAEERLSKLNDGNNGIPPKPKVLGILPNFI